MAVCAIVAGRQAKNVDPMSSQAASSPASTPPSQAFYESAMGAFPHKLSDAQGFEFKRAKVLMAIACIQFGWILEHQTHLGEYVALACNAGFHNEKRWDRELTEIHRQERRRLVRISALPTTSTAADVSSGPPTHSKSFLPSPGMESSGFESNRATCAIQPKCMMRT